jgi:hypothetical protein
MTADPGHQLIEHHWPPAGVYAGSSDHQKIVTCRNGGRPSSGTGTPKITM